MTAKELAEAILKLPKEQQNLPVGYWVRTLLNPKWRFWEYKSIQLEKPIGQDKSSITFFVDEETEL